MAFPFRFALATICDSRDDFYPQREHIVLEELRKLEWLRQSGELLESQVLRSEAEVHDFASQVRQLGAHALIVFLPIWADPELSLRLHLQCRLPLLLLGNRRPDSSSLVGVLGAGGALDQTGQPHLRVYLDQEGGERTVGAFLRASAAAHALGQGKLLRFGGRSLGIVTADTNEMELAARFGVLAESMDQSEIVTRARQISPDRVEKQVRWVMERAQVEFSGLFTPEVLTRQVESYLAIKDLAGEKRADMVGVKCQRELSDGYVAQCLAHLLLGASQDAEGSKQPLVFACESDANGAVTMRILQLLSGGKPAALMDVRALDSATGRLILANCGAIPEEMTREEQAPPLSGCRLGRHSFGAGGHGGVAAQLRLGEVTLARLCIRRQSFWMAIAKGVSVPMSEEERGCIPATFPSGAVQTALDDRFLKEFGSNHLHLVFGDYVEELAQFCALTGIPYQIWE